MYRDKRTGEAIIRVTPKGKRVTAQVPFATLHHPTEMQNDDANLMLTHGRLGIFSQPGTGKTLTTMLGWDKTLREYDRLSRKRPLRTIVVIPVIAIRTWLSHMVAWRAQHPELNIGDIQLMRRGGDPIIDSASVVVIPYSVMSRMVEHDFMRLEQWSPSILIMDEADNARTHGTKIYRYLLEPDIGLAYKAAFFFPLTGTPIKRYSDDLFGVLRAIDVDLFKSLGLDRREKFLREFCREQKVKFGGMRFPRQQVVGNKNMERLNRLIYADLEPLAIRRMSADVDPYMPPIRERTITTDFKSNAEFDEMVAEILTSGVNADGVMERSDKASKALRLLGELKVPAVADYIISEVENKGANGSDRGILVLFWHKDVGQRLLDAIRVEGFTANLINGDTPQAAREEYEDKFNDKAIDVLFGQIKSMGVAINLQEGGDHVIFAERDWGAASEEQAYRRVARFGQRKKVIVDYCMADSPLDEMKAGVVVRKDVETARILDGDVD